MLLVFALQAAGPVHAATSQFELRSNYLLAREKLRQGRFGEFHQLAKRLDGYLLRPYLDYYDLRRRLASVPTREVLAFTQVNAELPVSPQLYNRWLRELGKRRQWRTLLEHYRPTTNAQVRCYYLRALYGTGSKEQALDETTTLWLQPVSQPKACDPLFEVWRNTPRFTENIVWQRFSAAISANERKLARYLIRYLSGSNKRAAEAYYAVHVNPTRLTRTSQYDEDTPRYRTLVSHGLSRLATRDVDKAERAWQVYRDKLSFNALTVQRIDGALAVNKAKEAQFPAVEDRPRYVDGDVVEGLAGAAVDNQNWAEAVVWIERLPQDIQQKSQWQYWMGRALRETDGRERADGLFSSLARERHYYGFLAARQLGLPGRMNAAARRATNVDLARIQRIPGIQRSVELFAVGDELNGRREWYKVLNNLRLDQQVLAAELAAQLGLVSMGIRTANIAEATNHLHLRFPLAYVPQFRRASLSTALAVPFLIAIARQESALEAEARSSADARGLMQLLPSTARIVAKRANIALASTQGLYDPGTNIALGSYHLAWLMQRYDGQSPLAIAAYNAGEHRVDRWIKDADRTLMDVWIEGIPFRETRNHVKNVLAFRHVYGDTLKTPTPVLNPNEQFVRIP